MPIKFAAFVLIAFAIAPLFVEAGIKALEKIRAPLAAMYIFLLTAAACAVTVFSIFFWVMGF